MANQLKPLDSQFVLQVFFDSECPLCRREVNMIKWMDRKRKIQFTDIADSEFDASELGKSQKMLMDEIHGRLADGSWITGVEVFRQIYSAIGFRLLVWPTRLPLIRHSLEWAYRWFARNRLRLTGRCSGGECTVESNQNPTSTKAST